MKRRVYPIVLCTAFAAVIASVQLAGLSAGRPDEQDLGPVERIKAVAVSQSAEPPSERSMLPTIEDWAAHYGVPEASKMAPPPTLQDTKVDGAFSVYSDGQFRADRRALDIFEYFFPASGEEDEGVIRGRIILHALEHQLPENAVAQIVDALDQYIAFRNGVRTMAARHDESLSDIRVRMERVRAIRRETLGEELAHAFFDEHDQELLLAVERRESADRIMAGKNTPDPSLRALEDMKAERRSTVAAARLSNKVMKMRGAGADESEIFDARAAVYGGAAAQRLAALDQERRDWEQRLSAYKDARAMLLRNGGDPAESAAISS